MAPERLHKFQRLSTHTVYNSLILKVMSWFRVSNTFAKSRKIEQALSFVSNTDTMLYNKSRTACSLDFPC